MAYVNQNPNTPPPAPRFSIDRAAIAHISARLAHPRLRLGCALTFAALLSAFVLLLALAPAYTPFSPGLDLQPARLLEPLRHYLFRNAVINTAILIVAVYAIALMLGWTWAATGIPRTARPFLLAPIFIPGALIGLLWQWVFAGWLDIAATPVSLTITGVVLLWRATPFAAWFLSHDRDNWPRFIPLCALLILLDGTLILTLTRGEPFNAAHTWPSWLFQQLWVSRAWGHAAAISLMLAFTLTALTWWAARPNPTAATVPHGSPLGLTALLIWLIGPLLMPLTWWLRAPLSAINDLTTRGAPIWLLNGALLWIGTTLLARAIAWRLTTARARVWARTLTVALFPIALTAFAYLAHTWPFLRGLWFLTLVAALFTAGLLMGDTTNANRPRWRTSAGYAALTIVTLFPLQLLLQLPARAWSPALGITWTLANAPSAHAALGLALLLFALWSCLAAWLLVGARGKLERNEPNV